MPEISNLYSPTFNQFKRSTFNGNQGIQTNISTPIRTGLNFDTVQIGGENKTNNKNNTKNILLGLGAATVAVVAGVLGHHAIQANKLNKAFAAIDTKFANLEQNLPEVQSKFQEIFRRKDLTLEQTKEMLGQYKQLERLRVDKKVSNQDYIRQVFDVAKKNYNLENGNIELNFSPLKDSKAAGSWESFRNAVTLKENLQKESAFEVIHHELRHAKQTQEIAECLSEKDLENSIKIDGFKKVKDILNFTTIEQFEKEVWTPEFANSIMNDSLRLKRVGVIKTPEDIDFAKKCRDADINHVDLDEDMAGYWNSFKEIDARKAELAINELFGLNKSTADFYKEMDAKYLK